MPASVQPQTRRRVLLTSGAAAFLVSPARVLSQGREARIGEMRLTQILDMSPAQQDLSRDYATGVRLAFLELKDAKVVLPQLVTVETDGSAAAVREAVLATQQDASQLGLVGVAGEVAAIQTVEAMREAKADLPLIAPWLADSRFDDEPGLSLLFASRNQQLKEPVRRRRDNAARVCLLSLPPPRAGRLPG